MAAASAHPHQGCAASSFRFREEVLVELPVLHALAPMTLGYKGLSQPPACRSVRKFNERAPSYGYRGVHAPGSVVVYPLLQQWYANTTYELYRLSAVDTSQH